MAFKMNMVNDGGGSSPKVLNNSRVSTRPKTVSSSSNAGGGSRSYASSSSNAGGGGRPKVPAKNPVVEPDYSSPPPLNNSIGYIGYYTSPANVSSLNSSNNSGNNNNNSGGFFSKLSGWVSGWVSSWGSNDNKKSNTTTSYTPPPGPTSYNGPYSANNNSSGGSTTTSSSTGGYYTNPANNNSPYLVNKNLASPQQPASTYAASYNNPSVIPDYSRNDDVAKVANASFTWGALDIVESLWDGLLWLSAAYADSQTQIAASNSYSLKAGQMLASTATAMEDTAPLIAYDVTAEGYAAQMKKAGISDDLAYGEVHKINDAAGKFVGSVALSFTPGSWASALVAAGSSTENALQSGATVDEAYLVGFGAFGLGFASDYGLDAISSVAKSSTRVVGDVFKYGLGGAGVAVIEPVGNSVLEYYTYGKDSYDSWWQYYNESGGMINTFIAGGTGLTKGTFSAVSSFVKIQEIYSSEAFIGKSNDFKTEWGEHAKYSGNLEYALIQQHQLLTAQGYKKSYVDFLTEYTSGNFDVNTEMHQAALKEFYTYGGVSVMSENNLVSSLNGDYGACAIGFPDSSQKKGGAWIVPLNEQVNNRNIFSQTDLDPITLERARKGITTVADSRPMWEVQYSGSFLKDKGIRFNSGPQNIQGASAAAMPGSKTYDLTTEGVMFTEALVPRVEFSFGDVIAKQIVSVIDNNTIPIIDLSDYGYPGIKFVKIS